MQQFYKANLNKIYYFLKIKKKLMPPFAARDLKGLNKFKFIW